MAEELDTEARLRIVERLLLYLINDLFEGDRETLQRFRDLLTPRQRSDLLQFSAGVPERELAKLYDNLVPGGDYYRFWFPRGQPIWDRIEQLSADLARVKEDQSTSKAKIDSTSKDLAALRDAYRRAQRQALEFELLLSDSEALSNERFRRVIHGTVFISESDPEKGQSIARAVSELVAVSGFEIAFQDDPKSGSWLTDIYFRARNLLQRKEVREVAEKVVRAAELAKIELPQAHAAQALARAAEGLIKAMSKADEASVVLSSLVAVTYKDHDGRTKVVIRALTPDQVQILKDNPALSTHPSLLKLFLGIDVDRPEILSVEAPSSEVSSISGQDLKQLPPLKMSKPRRRGKQQG